MMRSFLFLAIVLTVAPACKHDDGEAVGTTTVRSGTPDGPRVTDVRTTDASGDLATRLTSAICARERQCARANGRAETIGEQECSREMAGTASLTVQSLSCDPATARAGFETCLAAIQSQGCDGTMAFSDDLPACRPSQICGRGR